MQEPLSDDILKNIAQQLRHPAGDAGVLMGETMNESNIGMTHETIKALQLKDGETVLELGHGNGSHVATIFEQAAHIHYTGLEISTTMHHQAIEKNTIFIKNARATFTLYDGTKIPFADASFHKIMTVNTIYFWEDPLGLLKELYRVLNPEGQLCIAFAQKDFMEQLPFTQFGFNLFDDEKVTKLIAKSDFVLQEIIANEETVKSKTGETMIRKYGIVQLQKTSNAQQIITTSR